MQSTEKKEKKRLVQLVAENSYDICKICGGNKRTAIYRFRHTQYIPSHKPDLLYPVCRRCVYREVYGSKNFKKKLKEGTLDGNTKS